MTANDMDNESSAKQRNVYHLEDGEEVDPALYGLDDDSLSPQEIEYRKLEMKTNAKIDKILIKNLDKNPKAIYFMYGLSITASLSDAKYTLTSSAAFQMKQLSDTLSMELSRS